MPRAIVHPSLEMDAESAATAVSSNGIRTAVCTQCLVPLQIRRTLTQYSLPYLAQLYGNNTYQNSSFVGRKFIGPYTSASNYAEEQSSPLYSPFSRHLLKNRYKPGSYPQLVVEGRSKERTVVSQAKLTRLRPRSATERPFKLASRELRSKSATVFGINSNRRPLTGVHSSLTVTSGRYKGLKRPASVSGPPYLTRSILENGNRSSRFHSGCHAPVHALVPVLASDELTSQVSSLDLSDGSHGNDGICCDEEDSQVLEEECSDCKKRNLTLKSDSLIRGGSIKYWQPHDPQKGSLYDPIVKGSSKYHRKCCHVHRPDLAVLDSPGKWQYRANSIKESCHRYRFSRDEAGFLMDCKSKLSQLQEKYNIGNGRWEPKHQQTGGSRSKMTVEDKPE